MARHPLSDVAQRAKPLRQQLKQVFPNGKFSIRSSHFSGGNSLDVDWTNGPTTAAVEAITKQHPSIAYDEASGEVLLGGNRDVSYHRLFSLITDLHA